MDAEDDDDIYGSGGVDEDDQVTRQHGLNASALADGSGQKPADLEEGEEEDEDEDESDSDIDIIVEKKTEPKTELVAPASRTAPAKPATGRTPSVSADLNSQITRPPALKTETAGKATPTLTKPGSSYPAVKTSSIDVDAKPIHGPTGKLITEVDMDADFSEDEKPWRRPGTDMSDYFNYGFDEFTWASYCLKQDTLRKDIADTKKQMEDMQSLMGAPGGMPPMPSMPAGPNAQGGMPPMPGMEGIPPEFQQVMSQMLSQGMDPNQMDPAMMMQMMGGQQGGNQGQGQNYGGGQNYQQGHNQGYGYGGSGGDGGGGGGRGGRGGRRWQ
ncbi:MAG: hypothetical protein Q9218_004807 [Villophora microphyllina]